MQTTGSGFSDNNIALGGTVDHYFHTPGGHWLLVRGTAANVPTGLAGYAVGCMYQATDTGAIYANTGSVTSATWTLLESSIGGTATALVDSSGLNALTTIHTAVAVNNIAVQNSATGSVSANAVIMTAIGTDAAISLSIWPKGVTGILTLGLPTGTGDIVLGSSSAAQTVKIANGAGVSTVNIAVNGATGNVVNIGTGAFAATITIGNVTGATSVNYLAGSGKHIFTGVINATSPVFVTPVLGVATATSLLAAGSILSSTPAGGVGYSAGSGGAVTQITSRSTGVTLNTITGVITGINTSLAAGAEAIFTVTNSSVALTDVIVLSVQSGPTANTSIFTVSRVAAGSFDIKIHNLAGATADTGAPIINFAIIKGSAS